MTWSIKIGRVRGIDIFIHWTFLLFLGFIFTLYLVKGQGVWMAVQGAGFLASLFGCVLLHELGWFSSYPNPALKPKYRGLPLRPFHVPEGTDGERVVAGAMAGSSMKGNPVVLPKETLAALWRSVTKTS